MTSGVIFALVCGVIHLSSATRPGILVMAPKIFLADSTEKVCVTFHNIDFEVHLSFLLNSSESNEILSEEHYTITGGEGGCFEMSIPANIPGDTAEFTASAASTSDEDDYMFVDSVKVSIQSDSHITFIQTDKPQYKPGQTVKFRILTTSTDLRPLTQSISEIWIQDPSGTRMAQWRDVPNDQGLVSLEMELADEPIQGEWKISAEINEATETQTFKVEEYVLPKYEITVTPPQYILKDAELITGEVCAKYTFGQPVRGTVSIRSCIRTSGVYNYGYYSSSTERPCWEHEEQIMGCTRFSFPGSAVGLGMGPVWQSVQLVTEATVVEDGTGTILNKTQSGPDITRIPLTIDMSQVKEFYKPGLNYYGKGILKRPDGSPAADELVTIRKNTWLGDMHYELNVTSNQQGEFFIELPLTELGEENKLFSIRVSVPRFSNPSRDRPSIMEMPEAYVSVKPWFSPSGSFLQLDPVNGVKACEGSVNVGLTYTTTQQSQTKLLYSVMSRGNIVLRGEMVSLFEATEPIPTSTQIPVPEGNRTNCVGGMVWRPCGSPCMATCERPEPVCASVCQPRCQCPRKRPFFHNGHCIKKCEQDDDSDEDTEDLVPPLPYVAQAHFDIPLSPALASNPRVVVYYIREDGETVADSISFSVTHCLDHQVSVTFTDEEVMPGGQTSLDISSDPRSLCAVGVVDKSVNILGGKNQLTMDKVFSQLSSYDIHDLSAAGSDDEYCRQQLGEDDYDYDDDMMRPPLPGRPVPQNGPRARRSANDIPVREKRSFMYGSRYYSNHLDSSSAFKAVGVFSLTDLMLESRPCHKNRHEYYVAANFPLRGVQQPVEVALDNVAEPVPGSSTAKVAPAVRTYFPETWLWDLHSVGSSGHKSVNLEAPHTITDWVGSGFCMNARTGLGVSSDYTLRVFMPFFLSFTLPYSTVRGEDVKIPVTIFNYLSECLVIQVTLKASPHYTLVTGARRRRELVCGQRSATVHYLLRPLTLGKINITVKALSVEGEEEMTNDIVMSDQVGVRDAVTRELLVEPEGREEEYTFSAFMCPSETQTQIENATLTLPANLVPDSSRGFVSVVGDVMGPTLSGLDQLLRLPTGCGEQNMILFAPNIYVMRYLTATNQVTGEIRAKSLHFLRTGYQRELTYKHSDNSYSAFGESDDEGSMWLTAFVVKSFAQARPYIFIDENDVLASTDWFKARQLENGCFPQVGRVLHKDMKGGLAEGSSPATLTAFVLIAMVEAGIDDPAITEAVRCLEAQTVDDVYTLALLAYAYSIWDVNSPQRAAVMVRLADRAISEDGLTYWARPVEPHPSATADDLWTCPYGQSPSANVEITAYALLAYLQTPGSTAIVQGLPIVRWLSKQRNAYGGFASTQDTVVALQALSQYASMVYDQGLDLEVHVHSNGQIDRFQVTSDNSLLLQQQPLTVPNDVRFEVAGSGCALVQANVRYNVMDVEIDDELSFHLTGSVSRIPGSCDQRSVKICTHYLGEDGASNMAVVEIKMVSGWIPVKDSINRLKGSTELGLKRVDVNMNYVHFYFDELTGESKCFTLDVMQHVEVAGAKPAMLRVYDYYEQEKVTVTQYLIHTICGTKEEIPMEPGPQTGSPFEQRRVPVIRPDFVVVLSNGTGTLPQCPLCFSQPPDDFMDYVCSASHVYKASKRRGGHLKMRSDLRTRGSRPTAVNLNVVVTIPDHCSCDIINDLAHGDHVLLMTGEEGVQTVRRRQGTLMLDSHSVVVRVNGTMSSTERNIRRAVKRRTCDN